MSEETRPIVYASLGPVLKVFGLDPASGALEPVQTIRMASTIQYACYNRQKTRMYFALSGSGPMAEVKKAEHFVETYAIEASSGHLSKLGETVVLDNRPLYIALDREEAHVLLAYNDPPDATVHALRDDGTVGDQVPQPPLEFGQTVHQVELTPLGDIVLVPACAHHLTGLDAGYVSLFSYDRGRMSPLGLLEGLPERAAPWQGRKYGAQGFAARHVAFHPSRPWMYLCVERQGEIWLYDYEKGHIASRPRAIRSTLHGAPPERSMQLASAIHVHPNGRFVYVSNRARETEKIGDRDVFIGGTNDVAVFEIDQKTGVPEPVQSIDTQGIFPRTFGLDADHSVIVAGNEKPLWVRSGEDIKRVTPSIVVFRIRKDGRLEFLNKLDHEDNGEVCFWTDVLSIPAKP